MIGVSFRYYLGMMAGIGMPTLRDDEAGVAQAARGLIKRTSYGSSPVGRWLAKGLLGDVSAKIASK